MSSKSASQDATPDLASAYASVKERVAAAAARSGRRPEDVLVVAVSKYAEMDQLRTLVDLGHVDFGENQVQQLAQRTRSSPSRSGRWAGRATPRAACPTASAGT